MSIAVYDGETIFNESLLMQDSSGLGTGDMLVSGSSTTAQVQMPATRTWIANEFVGFMFRAIGDLSEAVITANTVDGLVTFSGGLSGGNVNEAAAGQRWEIVTILDAGDELNFPDVVTMISEQALLTYSLTDVSLAETSPDVTVELNYPDAVNGQYSVTISPKFIPRLELMASGGVDAVNVDLFRTTGGGTSP